MKDADNKYILPEEAVDYFCPEKDKRCDGDLCMAWKWSGYAIIYENNQMTNTHGCCGLVYHGNITKVEIK